ncbi:MAG: ubiquinol-cytochrome C chaperone family protein [Hyphomonadaceae bacterium]
MAQAFTDTLFRFFDAGLREAGVGDLTVPKRMHKLAASFYGRLNAYVAAIEAEDRPALGRGYRA